MKIRGVLEPFFETGCEGIIWSVVEDGKEGFAGLNIIEEGDRLKIYGENGEVIFDGIIECDRLSGWTEYPLNPGHGQPSALGYWIHWTQRGWRPDDWAKLFFYQYLPGNENKIPLRAELKKKRWWRKKIKIFVVRLIARITIIAYRIRKRRWLADGEIPDKD